MTQSSTGWIGLPAVRILVLDDSPNTTEEIQDVLLHAEIPGEVAYVADRRALEECLDRQSVTAIVVALRQDVAPIVSVVDVVRSRDAAVPVIAVAERADDLLAAECIKAGAAEYVRRSHISGFARALSEALATSQARRRAVQAGEDLRLRERRFRALIEHSHDAVMLMDAEGTIIFASPATTSILGYPLADVIGQNTFRLVHPDDREAIRSHFRRCANRSGLSIRAEFRCRHREGNWRFLEGVAVNRLDDPAVHAVIADIRDITDRKHAEFALRASEQRYALAARGANDGLWDWDLLEDRVYFSDRWKAMLGYEAHEVTTDPREWLDRIHPQDRAAVHRTLEDHKEERAPHFESEHRLLHRDGEYRWMLCRGLMVRDEDGRPARMAGSLTDITDRKTVEERLKYDAVHDALTGLPNRLMFVELLDRAVAHSRKDPDYGFAVLFIDLDRFKVINDSLGHLIGDQLLIAFARRLERCLRPGDTVARLGGDEFTVLVERVRSGAEATRIADRIHRSLQHPFELRGYEVFTGVSIGIVSSTTGYESAP
jgi:diguanylate cyclase (GGDEF)-like protein/PAS domain S-box-containing protein